MTAARPSIEIFLQPGEYYVGDESCRIRTLLGSCVSITLWHPGRRIGAMSHCLLATRGGSTYAELDARYVDEALALMFRDLARRNIVPQQCQAKLFGGGNMFPEQNSRPGALDVGQQNGRAARELMREHNIAVVSESLFGIGHRSIVFDIATGDVWARSGPKGVSGGPETSG